MKYSLEGLTSFYAQLLIAAGVPEERARRLARVQLEIQAFGVTTHGVRVIHSLLESIRDGKVSPSTEAPTIREFGGTAVLDGEGCISVEALLRGRDLAWQKAKTYGVAMVSILRMGWMGVLGYHLSEAAREGYLCMGWAQMSDYPTVAPFGGRAARLSTNPMAICFPASPDPFVADFSTSISSNGKIKVMKAKGVECPEPMLIDAEGKLSTDPGLYKAGGAILPFGGKNFGFRGTALALWVEALTAAAGNLPTNRQGIGGQNAHILMVHADALGDRDFYDNAIRDMKEYILSSPPAENSTGPMLSGSAEWRKLADSLENGVELSDLLEIDGREWGELLKVEFPKE